MWANFHMHSLYCDGAGEMTEYVEKAIAEGMPSLGFSSHAPVPFDCAWCMKKENLTAYLKDIESLKVNYPSVQLYKGMEVDYIPGVVSPADVKPQLDYTVGSIHFVDRFPDGRPWEIDGHHAGFLEGLKIIFNNDIRQVISRYYELTRDMVRTSSPDIVGHLDKIKIQNRDEKFFKETDPWYVAEIEKTLAVIADAGAIVEVNTRGLYQKKSTTPYPSPWILKKIHERNIPVTLSSDAHRPDDIINQFEQTAALLIAIGFRKISILKDGLWKPVTFTAHGITQ